MKAQKLTVVNAVREVTFISLFPLFNWFLKLIAHVCNDRLNTRYPTSPTGK